jgi:hypothetical protein
VHIFIGVSVHICINIYVCTVFFFKTHTLFRFFITYAAPLLLSGVGGLPRSKKKIPSLQKKQVLE